MHRLTRVASISGAVLISLPAAGDTKNGLLFSPACDHWGTWGSSPDRAFASACRWDRFLGQSFDQIDLVKRSIKAKNTFGDWSVSLAAGYRPVRT